MQKSNNPLVQQFLEELMMFNDHQWSIVQRLREIVFEVAPTVSERMMYGGIMFSAPEDYGGVFASKHHVSFEFGNGIAFADPEKVLEGTGKFRRHLKIKTLDDIKTKNVESFVRQAV
jgi:hypothetical protein